MKQETKVLVFNRPLPSSLPILYRRGVFEGVVYEP